MKIKEIIFWTLVCIFGTIFVWMLSGPACLDGIFCPKKDKDELKYCNPVLCFKGV